MLVNNELHDIHPFITCIVSHTHWHTFATTVPEHVSQHERSASSATDANTCTESSVHSAVNNLLRQLSMQFTNAVFASGTGK